MVIVLYVYYCSGNDDALRHKRIVDSQENVNYLKSGFLLKRLTSRQRPGFIIILIIANNSNDASSPSSCTMTTVFEYQQVRICITILVKNSASLCKSSSVDEQKSPANNNRDRRRLFIASFVLSRLSRCCAADFKPFRSIFIYLFEYVQEQIIHFRFEFKKPFEHYICEETQYLTLNHLNNL